jgi:protein disulfide-isomerase A1
LRKKTGPPCKELKSAAEVTSWNESHDAGVVFFGTDADLYSVYQNAARTSDDVPFAHCSADDCMSTFSAKNGQVTMFKKFDDKRNDLTESFTEKSLGEFVSRNSSPKVMKFDEKTAQLIFGKATPGLFFYRDPNSSNAASIESVAAVVSEKLAGKLKIIVTGITEGLEQRLAEYVGVTAADLPSVRIHDTRTDLKKFNMSGDITAENVEQFVADWEAGNLKAHLKSEEIPATNDEPVKILVGGNFHSIVFDETKDVLVEFYAPWCGHCKKLSPIWDELALKLQSSNPNIVIAKMDSTANEVEEVSVQGFPTLKWYPMGNKKAPVDYSGERDLAGFMAFLEKNASGAFKKEDL